MALSEQDRATLSAKLQQYWSSLWTPIPLARDEFRGAIDDTDDWIEANQASYNSSLSTAVQAGLTTNQKTLLFCVVAIARVNIDWLKRLVR